MSEAALSVPSKSKFNVYAAITNKIVAAIEAGAGQYKMPWHTAAPVGIPINAVTHAEYRGVNVLALWIDALARGYPSGTWASYKQWQDIGAQVRHGERGSLIVFYKQLELTPLEETDPAQRATRRYMARASWVFNVAQVDGYTPPEPERPLDEFERWGLAGSFFGAVGAKVEHGHQMARYRPDLDLIEMPNPEWFISTDISSASDSYFAVRSHETIHWTGARHRLNRTFGKRFGDQAYAMEELVAEIGSAFLCALLGISSKPCADHAAYIAQWLTVLRNDSRAVFTAASAAQEAYEYLAHLVTKNDTPITP